MPVSESLPPNNQNARIFTQNTRLVVVYSAMAENDCDLMQRLHCIAKSNGLISACPFANKRRDLFRVCKQCFCTTCSDRKMRCACNWLPSDDDLLSSSLPACNVGLSRKVTCFHCLRRHGAMRLQCQATSYTLQCRERSLCFPQEHDSGMRRRFGSLLGIQEVSRWQRRRRRKKHLKTWSRRMISSRSGW